MHFSYFLLLAKGITILHSKSSPIVRPVLLDLRQLKDDFKRANIRSRGTKKRKEKMERLCSSFEGPSLRMESWRNERHFTTLALLSPLFRPFSLSQLTFLANCFNCFLIKFWHWQWLKKKKNYDKKYRTNENREINRDNGVEV